MNVTNKEMYEEGLYSNDQYFKETKETFALESDATGLWVIFNTAFQNNDGRFSSALVEVFYEPENGREYNRKIEECYDNGLFSSVRAEHLKVICSGLTVTRYNIASVVVKGLIRLVGTFDRDEETITTFKTAEIFCDRKDSFRNLKPRYEFEAKITMNSLAKLSLTLVKKLPDDFEISNITVVPSEAKERPKRAMSAVMRMLGVS